MTAVLQNPREADKSYYLNFLNTEADSAAVPRSCNEATM